MNSNSEKKPKAKIDLEALLALLLLIVILFAVVFTVIFVVDLLRSSDPQNENENSAKDPTVSTAIFSNGTVPKMPTSNANTQEVSSLYSDYGVIIDVENGVVLAGKNADTQFSPASMAKVMTLIVACEKLTNEDLTKQVEYTEYYDTYDYNGLSVAFSTLPTDEHLRIVVKDILYGIGVLSAGDCCLMIAEYTYGSLDAFVAAMNQKAAALGLTKTKFADAAGDDLPGNVTTAREMAVIMAYAMQCPLIREILAEDGYAYYPRYTDANGTEMSYDRYWFYSTLYELNNGATRMDKYKAEYGKSFLLSTAKDFLGKTGYLDNPARSYLVCAATGKTTGNTYVAVVGDTNRFAYTMKDVKDLFDGYAK